MVGAHLAASSIYMEFKLDLDFESWDHPPFVDDDGISESWVLYVLYNWALSMVIFYHGNIIIIIVLS